MTESTRQSIDREIANGRHNSALRQLKELYTASPNLGSAQFVLDRMSRIGEERIAASCRLAILRSFTVEPVVPLLRASASLCGVEIIPWCGQFNAYAQEMLTQDSELYRFEPQVVILAMQTRDLTPDLWQRFPELTASEIDTTIAQTVAQLRSLVGAFRANSSAHLIIQNLETPAWPSAGILDGQHSCSQLEAISRINAAISLVARESTGVYVLDYDGLVARFGRDRWHDERKWLTMRMPIAADALRFLAEEYVRFLLPLTGCTCKALVVDLDNTLWGGVIGEDGLHGIRIGAEYPGAAFQQLQRAVLDLYQRGILLAICSKNNLADAMEVFEKREEMLLKPHHFAAMRINWQDKAQNLREIAAQLNIGVDALAFLDDNPVERQRVQTELPEVIVLDLPENPMQYADVLRSSPVFERLTLSAEDRERGQYYAEQRQRQELQQNTGTLEGFLCSLQMEAQFDPVTPANLSRVTQLTQKTNQFNLTTRRYTEQQISAMANGSDWDVVGLRIRDRFGDNGLVGVAIVQQKKDVCEIDTLLMSCRVIGRTVETALLAHLAGLARRRGANRLHGWFFPTKKNAPSEEFYPGHGFKSILENEDGVLWELDLLEAEIQSPEWIALREADNRV